MSFVRVLCAAAAAVVVSSSAIITTAVAGSTTAIAGPAVLAAAGPGTSAGTPAATSAPSAGEAIATAPVTAEAPQLNGHQASDAALPPAVAAGTSPATEPAAALAPPKPTLFADINLATQTLTVSDTNGQLYRWPISSARGGYVTPTGTYTANWTSRMHYSKQYNWAPMPHAVFFHEGVAVHATNAVGDLGSPASHGCVRLAPKNARTFYNLVEKHGTRLTQIVVHGKPPYSPVVAERRQRRYATGPAFQPFGFFAYEQPAPRQRRAVKRQRYGGGYGNTW